MPTKFASGRFAIAQCDKKYGRGMAKVMNQRSAGRGR
jgi:hypothetical protein